MKSSHFETLALLILLLSSGSVRADGLLPNLTDSETHSVTGYGAEQKIRDINSSRSCQDQTNDKDAIEREIRNKMRALDVELTLQEARKDTAGAFETRKKKASLQGSLNKYKAKICAVPTS